MKKFLSILLTGVLLVGALTGCQSKKESTEGKASKPENRLEQIKASGKLVMGTSPDFAPSEFIDNTSGKSVYVGSDIELAKYIADSLGVELEIKAMEFSAIQQAIQSGTIDIGIAGFAYSEKRAEAMGLTEKFNIDSNGSYQGLMVLKENAKKYNTKESFSGKKVVAQNASLQQSLVESQLPKDVVFQPVTSTSDGVMMVITGKADAMAVDSDNAKNLMQNYAEAGMAEFQFQYEGDGNVAAVKKGETELLEAINQIISEVNEKGLYEKWTEEARELADHLGIAMEE